MTASTARRAAAWLLALVLPLALAGCSDDAAGDAGYISGRGVVTVLPPDERRPPASELSGETLDGERVTLSDYAGEVVVVNVWGSWCPPCRAEAPDLVAAAEQLSDDGVQFLGVNVRDLDPSNARAFVRRYDVPYPSIYDQGGEALLAFHGTLTPNTIPSTVIVDERGRVAASVLGEVDDKTLVGLVADVATRPVTGDRGRAATEA